MSMSTELHYGVRSSDHITDFGTDAHRAADENRARNAEGTESELVCRRVIYGTWRRAAYQTGPPPNARSDTQ